MEGSRRDNRGALTGTVIAERYELQERIGVGASAVVYRAQDRQSGREIALKMLNRRLAEDPRVVARFQREAAAAARLSHPNICQVVGTGQDDGVHFIAMEYLPHPDLKQIVREYAPLPPRKVLDLGVQVSAALEYAHAHGLVHLDLKPQNILFTSDGRVKVADFGLARALDEGSEPEEIRGTVPYAAPERARGADVQPSMDVYSLGAVLYECMTGRLPFRGETAEDVVAAQTHDRPASPRALNPATPSALEFIAMKALNREPSRRYRSMAEMQYDLSRVQGGESLDQTGVLPRDGELQELGVPEEPLDEEPEDLGRVVTGGRRAVVTWGPRVLAVVVALLVLFGVYKVVRAVFWPETLDANVVVPKVLGMSLAEAEQMINDAWLEVGRVDYDKSDDYEAGRVIKQWPKPEDFARVPRDTKVDLTVAEGTGQVIVVVVEGDALEEAKSRLRQARLTVGKVEPRYDDEVPAGHVIQQAIKSPQRLQAGDPVDLVVSLGPEPEPPVVPPPGVIPPGVAPGEIHDSDAELSDEHDPDVTVEPVAAEGLAAGVMRFRVEARARGEQEQRIRVIKTDDDNLGGTDILDIVLRPGQSGGKTFTGKGSVRVEAFVDGERVLKPWVFPAEAEESAP